MFGLDIKLFNLLFSYCYKLGSAFDLGAFEGFIIYLGVIALGLTGSLNQIQRKKKNDY
ncbi:hypothetical protein [Candidatus Clostridium helianthi]|jgi:hypothetical protein|uniref:Uncharacterized protein n=1 Tax=Candidatus Clostridium helianthi TaxID=3381660 RepID=A0ABW8S3Y1_9CLOT